MKIYLGADHAGYKLKEKVKSILDDLGFEYVDMGTNSEDEVDYPDYAFTVAKRVAKGEGKGVLICGTGTGMCIAANRVRGVRAVSAWDAYSAKMSRIDNDSNVLCLRGRRFPFKDAENVLRVWLQTAFSEEIRHKRRVRKLDK